MTQSLLQLTCSVFPFGAVPINEPQLVLNLTSTNYTLTNLQVDREIDRPG